MQWQQQQLQQLRRFACRGAAACIMMHILFYRRAQTRVSEIGLVLASPQSCRSDHGLVMPAHFFSFSILQGWVGGWTVKQNSMLDNHYVYMYAVVTAAATTASPLYMSWSGCMYNDAYRFSTGTDSSIKN